MRFLLQFKMRNLCTVSWLERQCAKRYLFHTLAAGGGGGPGTWVLGRKGGVGLGRGLVTRFAATSKSQIASDCNRNSKKSLRLRKHPLKPTLWTREPPVFCGFYSVSEAPHGSGNPQNTLRLQGCDSESLRFFWPNAIFVIATLRFYCDFCGKSLRLRNCDCQSLAICDCDCVGH